MGGRDGGWVAAGDLGARLEDTRGALLSATDPTQYAGLAQSISSLAEAAAALRKLQ